MSIKQTFDPRKVLQKIRKQEKAFLYKAGGYIRTTARRSIPKTKTPSAPGGPPSSPTGNIRKIAFAVDDERLYVVVGPIFWPSALSRGVAPPKIETRNPFMEPALGAALSKFDELFSYGG